MRARSPWRSGCTPARAGCSRFTTTPPAAWRSAVRWRPRCRLSGTAFRSISRPRKLRGNGAGARRAAARRAGADPELRHRPDQPVAHPRAEHPGADGRRPGPGLRDARNPPRARHRRGHAARRRGARPPRGALAIRVLRARIPRRFRSRPAPPPARCSTLFNWTGSESLLRRFRQAVSS